jgi:hypothetical protein
MIKNSVLAMNSIVIIGFLASPVQAQSESWQGAFGQVGIGYQSTSLSYSPWTYYPSGGGAYPGTSTANNANNFALTLGVGYYFALSPSFILGVGGEYAPLAGSKANTTSSYSGSGSSTTGQYNIENAYNLYIGYAGAQTKTSSNNTYSYNGYSLGLGYKQFFTEHIYGFGEVNYTDYGNSNNRTDYNFSGTSTLKATNYLVGVGYKF